MKKVILGVLALIVPMALVIYVSMVLRGDAIANFFGAVFIGLMCARTVRYFGLVGKKGAYTDNTDAFRSALVFNAAVAVFHALAGLAYGKIFVAGFEDMVLRFSPIMAAVAYGCMLGIVACSIRLINNYNNYWTNSWEKANTWSILGVVASIMTACAAETVKPYGIVFPEAVSKIVAVIVSISVLGLIITGYKLTVYDIEHA